MLGDGVPIVEQAELGRGGHGLAARPCRSDAGACRCTTVSRGYTASADPVALGFIIDALIEVDLPGGADTAAFEAALRDT
jgi:hypothetical protein